MALNQINLYGVIGEDVRAVDVKNALLAMDQTQPLVVKIDSEGGSVFDGFSIANAFEDYAGPKKAIIEPSAFSIASYIVAVFDDVEIVQNGYIMAHMPYTSVEGTAADLSNSAALLTDLEAKMVARYVEKTGMSEDDIRAMLTKETFLNAEESVAMGLAKRIMPKATPTRAMPTAKHQAMPTRVYAALFGSAALGGEDRVTTEKTTMSQTQEPVAATVKDIKAAFPKAKSDFIVKCLEKGLPLASVAAAAAEELMAENEEMMAKYKAMEEELMALRAKAMEQEDTVAMDDDEEDESVMATARAKGAKPVAKASSSAVVPAASRWEAAVGDEVAKGKSRVKAIIAANRKNPGLREQMLAEANAR